MVKKKEKIMLDIHGREIDFFDQMVSCKENRPQKGVEQVDHRG